MCFWDGGKADSMCPELGYGSRSGVRASRFCRKYAIYYGIFTTCFGIMYWGSRQSNRALPENIFTARPQPYANRTHQKNVGAGYCFPADPKQRSVRSQADADPKNHASSEHDLLREGYALEENNHDRMAHELTKKTEKTSMSQIGDRNHVQQAAFTPIGEAALAPSFFSNLGPAADQPVHLIRAASRAIGERLLPRPHRRMGIPPRRGCGDG